MYFQFYMFCYIMTKVTLYYANWCGHCKTFKPVWDSLKPYFDKNKVEYIDYEETAFPDIIKNDKIEAFPTIMIEKNGMKYEYNGDRTVDGLVRELMPNLQLGGSKRIRKYKIYYN